MWNSFIFVVLCWPFFFSFSVWWTMLPLAFCLVVLRMFFLDTRGRHIMWEGQTSGATDRMKMFFLGVRKACNRPHIQNLAHIDNFGAWTTYRARKYQIMDSFIHCAKKRHISKNSQASWMQLFWMPSENLIYGSLMTWDFFFLSEIKLCH